MSLGLTLCQAKVYLALCNFGVLDAKSIAKYADVPRPDVYRVVNELEKSGLIDRNLSRPTTFQALELDRGIDILLKKRREETEKITALTRIILTKKQEKKLNCLVMSMIMFFWLEEHKSMRGQENLLMELKDFWMLWVHGKGSNIYSPFPNLLRMRGLGELKPDS